MWFPLALTAMLCWSGSDLFSKIGSRPEDKYSHWKLVMAVGLVMGLHACYEIFVSHVEINLGVIITYLPASALYILSMILGYVGLRYIELSVSSPICNSSGAVAALLCFFFLHQRLVGLQWLGVVLVAAGIIALGFIERNEDEAARELRREPQHLKYEKSAIALLFPILYCLLDAAGTFADAVILETLAEESANVAYELTFLFMGVCAFIYVKLIKKQPIMPKREAPKLAAALFETAGQFAYVFALGANAIAAAPVISAYCMVSVIWSRIFLHEKLSRNHYLAIAAAIAGIIILGIFDA